MPYDLQAPQDGHPHGRCGWRRRRSAGRACPARTTGRRSGPRRWAGTTDDKPSGNYQYFVRSVQGSHERDDWDTW